MRGTRRVADIDTKSAPNETIELRSALEKFKRRKLSDHFGNVPLTRTGTSITVGAVKWGVYAFFDYDDEPIYVGQTRETVGGRIGRHLTNQRTDAVAMSVLDPFEVRKIKVWLLPQYQDVKGDPKRVQAAREAADHLNSLERSVFMKLVEESDFGRILNEKDPPDVPCCDLPPVIEGEIVGPDVLKIRQHPDLRIARRTQTIARLAQIIAGRDVQAGLRRALATQADRLAWLANERFLALGGEAAVEEREVDDLTDDDGNA
ncbi:GIY-YIG nuclease family protein [Sphingomonas sp. GB1N7]|uniref:GIY-YIG nuclease family protein n=1 Tax=Parasphingomonas caseinilytica TaxID=3096158 RepID=UPI002FC80217